jgi:hypothetical protein
MHPHTPRESEPKRQRLGTYEGTPTFDELMGHEATYRATAQEFVSHTRYHHAATSADIYRSYHTPHDHAQLQSYENRPPIVTHRQGSTASAQSLLGDVAEGLNEFDLFNGELLDSDQDDSNTMRSSTRTNSHFRP